MPRTGEDRPSGAEQTQRRVREAMPARGWARLAALPLVLAAAASLTMHAHVENDLRQRAERGAYSAGVPGVDVTVHGRDVVARVPGGLSEATKATLVAGLERVDGVRDVTVTR